MLIDFDKNYYFVALDSFYESEVYEMVCWKQARIFFAIDTYERGFIQLLR